MAWMASNIFVHTGDPPAVVSAISDLLSAPAHAADPEGVLDEPVPMLVSPAVEGWVAVTGARGFFDALPWVAAEVSRATRAPAVACELVGNSYALRLTRCRAGEREDEQRTPAEGWTDRTAELAQMPLYEDAERQALERLRTEGVPTPLILIGTSPLAEPARPLVSLGEGTTLSRAGASASSAPVDVRAPVATGDDPPVLPTGAGRDFGLMLFEDRYVEGRPSLAAVDRLLAIEEEILARARRACPAAQVTLTITYHAGAHQDLLDEELRSRGRPTAAHLERGERVPWWQFWRYFGKLR